MIRDGPLPARFARVWIVPRPRSVLAAYKKAVDGGVRKGYFDEMDTICGTIKRYFSEGLGIDAAEQETLRDLLLGRE